MTEQHDSIYQFKKLKDGIIVEKVSSDHTLSRVIVGALKEVLKEEEQQNESINQTS
ncbi:TPA: hypothetical protein R1928_002434 [Staphylococcus delphini]|uniref:hypothetical protein n=2 Tax=Staphylococcus TaxID=1279 RepID=UPI0015CA04F6|nr:hypothetical protein [Staphylococcus delphini]EMC0274966.1 hypothetical protein [Staphylococcus pseudintermedius]HEC2144726.1 hypothetical protein [Staphylococcus delphini]HEC2150311.1 hypothetical protein [Staphylococcus delphini]HEC2171155.1 hypothetical protein [Staphylococcus delphini]HEC2179112.1 hypothetical protein [Staphylococcus delphini]